MTLATKLHPDRFSAISGKMAAIVGYILGESWTEPEIAALSVTSDGFVLTDAEFFGEAADLDRNLLNLLVAAETTMDERTEFERCYRERVDDWRPVLSGPQPATDRLTRPDFGALWVSMKDAQISPRNVQRRSRSTEHSSPLPS